MRCLRLVVFLVALLVTTGLAGISWVQAQEGLFYPPLVSACDIVDGILWEVPADEFVDGYTGCFVAGVEGVVEYGYLFECPPNTSFDYTYEACVYDDEPSTGGHQPWREGPRGYCPSWLDGYECSLWQEYYRLPDEYGNCAEGEILIKPDSSGLDTEICQVFSDEDTGDSEVIITGNGSESTTDVMILPNTGSGTIQHDNALAFVAMIATALSCIGCTIRYSHRTT
ncbi:MAG: hypothetical protein HZC02_04260 [Candidatus Levybacteria bacterium]|nr:hypothetical protein [Candidatus Levybacteria bacterium]